MTTHDGAQQRALDLEKRKRNKENGFQRKVDRISNEERMDKMITELSKEMDMRKRQWRELARTYEQFRWEDTVEEMKGENRRTIKQTEHTMMELDNFLFGNSNMNLAWKTSEVLKQNGSFRSHQTS